MRRGVGGVGETGDKMQSLYSRVSVYEPPFAFSSNWVEWFLRGLPLGWGAGEGSSSGHVTPPPERQSGAGQSWELGICVVFIHFFAASLIAFVLCLFVYLFFCVRASARLGSADRGARKDSWLFFAGL